MEPIRLYTADKDRLKKPLLSKIDNDSLYIWRLDKISDKAVEEKIDVNHIDELTFKSQLSYSKTSLAASLILICIYGIYQTYKTDYIMMVLFGSVFPAIISFCLLSRAKYLICQLQRRGGQQAILINEIIINVVINNRQKIEEWCRKNCIKFNYQLSQKPISYNLDKYSFNEKILNGMIESEVLLNHVTSGTILEVNSRNNTKYLIVLDNRSITLFRNDSQISTITGPDELLNISFPPFVIGKETIGIPFPKGESSFVMNKKDINKIREYLDTELISENPSMLNKLTKRAKYQIAISGLTFVTFVTIFTIVFLNGGADNIPKFIVAILPLSFLFFVKGLGIQKRAKRLTRLNRRS